MVLVIISGKIYTVRDYEADELIDLVSELQTPSELVGVDD